jgi:CRISPR-associated protein Csc3
MIPNEEKLKEEGKLIFQSSKVVGIALPKRPEFIYSTMVSAITWGGANLSVTLLRSLHLALKISLNEEVELPFILTSNLEIENQWNEYFGRVEGIQSTLVPFLGSGNYKRQGHSNPEYAPTTLSVEELLECLDCIEGISRSIASPRKRDDCFYDLAVAARRTLEIYYVVLRWILREKDESILDFTFDEIHSPLSKLVENLMTDKDKAVSQYLREAAQIACEGKLWGNLRRRTGRAEPFSAFLKAIRSFKSPLDWETVFASLANQYHTRLDRIREHGVGNPKYEYVSRYYNILYELFLKEYQSRPEKILNDGKALEAAYLHFLREAYKNSNQQDDQEK